MLNPIGRGLLGHELLNGRRTSLNVRQTLAGRAIGAAPHGQAALVGQELDRADMLGWVAVAAVTLVVAVHGMTAQTLGRRGHRHGRCHLRFELSTRAQARPSLGPVSYRTDFGRSDSHGNEHEEADEHEHSNGNEHEPRQFDSPIWIAMSDRLPHQPSLVPACPETQHRRSPQAVATPMCRQEHCLGGSQQHDQCHRSDPGQRGGSHRSSVRRGSRLGNGLLG